MSTTSEKVKVFDSFLFLAIALLVFAVAGVALADEGTRTSVSRHQLGGRDSPEIVAETAEEYGELATGGVRSKAQTRGASGKTSSPLKSGSYDFWFYEADVILFNDDDRDGYFHGIDLLFDADTIYSQAEVYAVLYLSLDGGPWNEYGVTEDFDIYGASATDEYVMVTELMSGYPTGSYDLLIELFDAWDGSFLASFGPEDTSELGYLPLEDFHRDAPPPRVVVNSGHGGGGSIDGWFIALFLLVLIGSGAHRIWRHRNDVLTRIDSPAPVWQNRYGGGR